MNGKTGIEIIELGKKVKAEIEAERLRKEKEADKREEFNRLLNEGLELISKKEYRKALVMFKEALALDPDSEEAKESVEKTKKIIRE